MKYLKTYTSTLAANMRGAVMKNLSKPIAVTVTLLSVLTLTACGDSVENRDAPPEPIVRTAVVENREVLQFRDSLYALFRQVTCKDCHFRGGIGNGEFADPNVNTAYSAALARVNPADTNSFYTDGDGGFVDKVRRGHRCWTNNCPSDSDQILAALNDWNSRLTAPVDEGGGTVDDTTPADEPQETALVEPAALNDPQDTRTFPETRPAEFSQFYDIVSNPVRCTRCHSRDGVEMLQRPYFADDDIDYAYEQVRTTGVVDLNVDPNEPLNSVFNSAVVYRLAAQNHNCFSANCATDAGMIRDAINALAGAIPQEPLDQNLVPSKALTLGEGQVTSGGARYDRFVIAKYEFKEGSDDNPLNDNVAQDTSGVEPTVHLSLFGNTRWVGGYGLEFNENSRARSTSVRQSQKLHDALVSRGEFSIEAWVIPSSSTAMGDVEIMGAPIVSYSVGTVNRNFTLAQYQTQYFFYNRVTDPTAGPELESPEGSLQTTLQHVVVTYSVTNGRRIYVNGDPVVCETQVEIGVDTGFTSLCPDPIVAGNPGELAQWDTGHLLTVGSDTDGNNQWLGKIKFLAIHQKELNEEQIDQNNEAGVGQKFNLLFNISSLKQTYPTEFTQDIGNRSYIWFVVSEYDDNSYLFSDPQFVDLDLASAPSIDFDLQGIRVGINGREEQVGQAFANLGKSPTDETTDADALRINNAGPVSLVDLQGQTHGITPAEGTVIAKSIDASTDQFFLIFDYIGGNLRSVRVPGVFGNIEFGNYEAGDAHVIGMRTFDEIIASMEAVTGLDRADFDATTQGKVDALRQQLPSSEGITAFNSSQQMAVANVAGIYCDQLVESNGGEAFFGVPGGTFGLDVTTAFPAADFTNANSIIAVLKTKFVGTNLQNQPANGTVAATDVVGDELMNLYRYLRGLDTHQCVEDLNPEDQDGNEQNCSNSTRTKAIVKGMCTGVLGSAAITQQ